MSLVYKELTLKEIKEMQNAEILRASLLSSMNSYIEAIGDKEDIETWSKYGFPFGCDEDKIMSAAQDENKFQRIAYLFGRLV
jgi:hypothetical protein